MEADESVKIPILFEDGYVLVINKPSGLLSEGAEASVETWAQKRAKSEPSAHRRNAILMHRLDKPASGIMVIAKTVMAAKNIQQQMLNNQFTKKYNCIVMGDANHLKGTIEHYLVKDALSKKSILATPKDKGAKKAVLRIDRVHFNKLHNWSLIEITLITGRYHQIRFQLSELGHPVCGDGLYASQMWKDYKEIALHAAEIGLIHPKTLEKLEFSCAPTDAVWSVFT